MAQNVEIGHVTKFDETFFNIWFIDKHSYSKQKKLWSVINGIEPKLTLPTIAEALLATKMRSINE